MGAAMPAELLPAIAVFARVAHHASFTRAAAELGVSPSALSQTIRMLERRLGVRLLDRTTRKVGVTEIGRRFLEEAQPGLAAIGRAIDGVDESREAPSGLLRINLPEVVARLVVLPHLGAFSAMYPDIVVELCCDNLFVDLVEHGFDAGFRLGESLAADMVAVPIGRADRIATFASPAYAAKHGLPRTPAELLDHRCACMRLDAGRSVIRWDYQEDGRYIDVEPTPALITNDGNLMVDAVREGVGIGQHFEPLVRGDFESGRLLPVLRDYWPSFGAFHLYYPSRVHMPRKLRVFIDFLRERHADTESPGALP